MIEKLNEPQNWFFGTIKNDKALARLTKRKRGRTNAQYQGTKEVTSKRMRLSLKGEENIMNNFIPINSTHSVRWTRAGGKMESDSLPSAKTFHQLQVAFLVSFAKCLRRKQRGD